MVTPLKITFPKTRDHLWDTSNAGETADIFPLRNDRLKLQFRASTLRLAVQHCQESRANCCFLLGSAECSLAEDLVISVDRFDPGVPTHSMDIGPTAVLDGDIPVRTSISIEEHEWRDRLPYSDRELGDAIDTLSALISQNQQVSLDMFLTLSLSILPLPHTGDIRLRASTLLSGSSLHLYTIPPIPVLPTALVRNLVGPSPIYMVQQRTRGGYLTMDESRRLLLLLDSDPKAPNFPIVGVWVGGPSSVHHPAVWAACMQYVFTELLPDRAAAPAKGFLLMLYTGGAGPAFFQCSSKDNQLLYSFLSAEITLSLSHEEITMCDLVSTSCPLSASTLKQSLLSLPSSGQLPFFKNPTPYPPLPTAPATLAFNREDSLLNLSIIESVASKAAIEPSNCSASDHNSFCQQVTSSMLLPQQTPIRHLDLSPLHNPAPSCDVTPSPLSAKETAVLLRDQQLQIEALQAQVEMLLQHQNTLSPPPPSSHCSTVTSLNHTLPSIHPNDIPSLISNDSTRSSALRELAPELLALSPPEPEQTSLFTSQHSNVSDQTPLATDHSGRSSRTPGASLISSLHSERDEPVRLFSTEFIRQNETHRELTVRQQTPALDTISFFSEPLEPPAVPPAVLSEAPILDTPGLSSIYIPRIQYQALPREDSLLCVRDPSDQLTLKYLEGRSILLDPSVQQLSFIQGGGDRVRTRESATGLNGISAMSMDTRAYLERHNLTATRITATGGMFSGGFMQDTSAMDTSFGTSSKGPAKREHTGGGRLVPVTALMIKRAAENKKSEGDDFILNGEVANQVKLVGQVQEVQETSAYCGYTLHDSSGSAVEVKRWTNVEDGVKEQNVRADIREGTYCCVIGNLRSFGDKTHIGCFTIFPLKSMNEITRHLLEVSYAHLEMTRAHYSSESMQMDSTPSSRPGTSSAISQAITQVNSSLSLIHRDACEVLRSCHKQFGLHIDDIVGKMSAKYPAIEIRNAMSYLCSEGLVYNSSDDDHFQLAES